MIGYRYSYKTESYHPLCMQNKRNGFVDMHDNRTVNLINLVFRTELWLSHEILRYYMLDISCISYSLWDVKRYETLHMVMSF